MSFVRQSKLRHVFCKPVKSDQCLSDIRITDISWDSAFCAVNAKFLAIIIKGAGGPFMVFPLMKTGRVDKNYPFVDAHRAPCLEVAWCPFNDNIIASCSEDALAKVWQIPDTGLNRTMSEPIVELNGHQKRVNTIVWHPTAGNLMLTAGGDNKILLWNVSTGEALIEIAGHPDQIWSVAFNYDGSKLVTTCKDRIIRVINPRSGTVLQQGQGHEGVKPQRAIFLKDGRIFTTGFTKRSERLYALRSEEDLENPIIQEELDTSNGILFPFFDEESGLLFLCGKGDCAIRYYEINQEPPFAHYINTYTTSEPQRGFAFVPKRALMAGENEISRFYKVRTNGVVDILPFFVPRKSELFQEDLYPDTRGTIPALTADEWIGGKNADPILIPMYVETKRADTRPRATIAKRANILAQQPPVSEQLASREKPPSPRPVRIDDEEDDTGIVRLEKSPTNAGKETSTSGYKAPSRIIQKEAPIGPGRQNALRSRADHDNGGLGTPGQRRAAAELELIKKDKERVTQVEAEIDHLPPTVASTNVSSRSQRGSFSSNVGEGGMDDMVTDIQKLKSVIRQHERRIRLLEDQLADKNMSDVWNL